MRFMRVGLWFVAVMLAIASAASAQSTTGTISGRVVDAQGLPVPGVTVLATSPNLQGTRETVTSENGDYILSLLPSGAYTVTFELSGFGPQTRTVTVAPTQVVPLEVEMGPAALSETIQVVGRSADVLTETAQVATNFSQELISTLPTNRDYRAVMLMAPSVHPTGPSGSFSVAGSMSFESLFMVNGVSVNENLRGQAQDLVIEDAVQETTVATAGISAEFGRFGGGVVNVITKSGGNQFTGSFRDTLTNDNWRALVPAPRRRSVCRRHQARRCRADLRVHGRRPGVSRPPVVLPRRPPADAGVQPPAGADQHPVCLHRQVVALRDQADLLARREPPLPGRVHDGRPRPVEQHVQPERCRWISRSLENRELPEDLFTVNYTGVAHVARCSSRPAIRSGT